MNKISFGLIGGGWRAEFYLRIARELPEVFNCAGAVIRDVSKAPAFERRWGIPTYRSVEELLARTALSYVVVSVPRQASAPLLTQLASTGVPVLAETPPAEDLDALNRLYRAVGSQARIQVAEQYLFQPLHAARLAVVRSGALGTVSQAQVSSAHGYHGVSLIRQYLQLQGHVPVRIRAQRFSSPIIKGPTRAGDPTEHALGNSDQTIASLDFGDRLGIYDFTGDQYFSWIRSSRLLVRGEKGELSGSTLRALHDFQTPYELELRRMQAGFDGNLEGSHLKGIMAGDRWVYRNPAAPGRLSDDEIAVATCMLKMGEYASGGVSFYSLADASEDHYLGMLIDWAIQTGEGVTSVPQAWAE